MSGDASLQRTEVTSVCCLLLLFVVVAYWCHHCTARLRIAAERSCGTSGHARGHPSSSSGRGAVVLAIFDVDYFLLLTFVRCGCGAGCVEWNGSWIFFRIFQQKRPRLP